MKNFSIRINERTAERLSEISSRPSVAAQHAVEITAWLKPLVIRELHGVFTREEIIGLADSFNGLIPSWDFMVNTSVLLAHTEDAEHYQQSISGHGADPVKLFEKLKKLSAAHAAMLQLELWSFWNADETNASPDLEKLITKFV